MPRGASHVSESRYLSDIVSEVPGHINETESYIWIVNISGIGVYGDFAQHLEESLDRQGNVLGKSTRVGIREAASTDVAILGPRGLFPGAISKQQLSWNTTTPPYEVLHVDAEDYERLNTTGRRIIEIRGMAMKDMHNNWGWTPLSSPATTKEKGPWKAMQASEFPNRAVQALIVCAIVLLACIPLLITLLFAGIKKLVGYVALFFEWADERIAGLFSDTPRFKEYTSFT